MGSAARFPADPLPRRSEPTDNLSSPAPASKTYRLTPVN